MSKAPVVQVLPATASDAAMHDLDPNCWCDPVAEPGRLVHRVTRGGPVPIDPEALAQAIFNVEHPEQSAIVSGYEADRAVDIVAEYDRIKGR